MGLRCGKCCTLCGETKDAPPMAGITPNSKRSCTDLLWLLVFVCAWVANFVILGEAIAKGGDPARIVRGIDWRGRICGVDDDVKDFPLAAWPYPAQYRFKLCVDDCARTQTDNTPQDPNPNGNGRMSIRYPSTRVVFYCIPTVVNGTIGVDVELDGDFESASEAVSRGFADLFTAWPVIVASAFIALAMAFVWTYLVERFASFMVWSAIFAVILGGFLLGYTLLEKAKEYDETEIDNRAKVVKGLGWTFVIGTAIFALVIFFLRKRIQIAIRVVQEAASALGDMKLLVFFPIIPFFLGCCYFVFWIITALYILSVGDFRDEPIPEDVAQRFGTSLDLYPDAPGINATAGAPFGTFKDRFFDDSFRQAALFHGFMLLWNAQFIVYLCYMVVAGSLAAWYFTERDSDGHKKRGSMPGELSNSPITQSFWRTIRYHLGTICLTALIIAIVQAIRVTIKYIEEKTKKAQGGELTRLQKCVFCAIHCCLYCLECCLDKINKNALVWTSIWGDSFATAACSSFALIWRNLARVAAIHIVGSYLLLLGKVTVAFLTAGIAGLIFITTPKYERELNSVAVPVCIIFVLAYVVGWVFMIVFEVIIETTFMCFLVDEAHNKGGNMFASQGLIDLVDRYSDENKESATRQKTTREFRTQRTFRGQGQVEDGGEDLPPQRG